MNQVQYRNWFSIVLVALLLQACSSFNPVKKADTAEQRAYALYGTFVILEEQAANLIDTGTLSNNAVIAIANADNRAKPAADSLQDAIAQYEQIKAQFASGQTTRDQVDIAATNLEGWIDEASPLIETFRKTVEGAK